MSYKHNTSESRYKSAAYGSQSFSGSGGFQRQYDDVKSPFRSFHDDDRYPKKQDYTPKEYPPRYDEKQQQSSRGFSSYKERNELSQEYTTKKNASSYNEMDKGNSFQKDGRYSKTPDYTSKARISQYDENSTRKLEDRSFSPYDERNQTGRDYTASYNDRNLQRSGYLDKARPPSGERNQQNQSSNARPSSFRYDAANSPRQDYTTKENSYKNEERNPGRLSSPRTSLLQGIKREAVKCDNCKKATSTSDSNKLPCGHTMCKDCNATIEKLETLTKSKNYCPVCTEISRKTKAKPEAVSRQDPKRGSGLPDVTTDVSTIQLQQPLIPCQFHVQEAAKGFCKTCDAPICSPCAKGKTHRRHSIDSLTTKLNEALVLLEKKHKTNNDLRPRLQQDLAEVNNQLTVNQEQKERVLLELDVTADRMVSLIRAKQHAARMEVEESFEAAKKPFTDIKELIETYQSDLDQAVKTTEETLKDNRLILNSKAINKASTDLDTIEGKISRIPTSADLYTVEFTPGKNEDLHFGDVSARKSAIWQLPDSHQERNVSEARQELQSPLLVNIIQLLVRDLTDFSITPDGDLGILGSWLLSKKNQIKIYDEKTGQEKGNLAEGMRCFVIHGNKMFGISEKRSNLVTITLNGEDRKVTKLKFDPNAITSDTRGNIYLACSQAFAVYKTSTRGEEFQLATKCKGFPCKIHITPDGDILTSEYSRQSHDNKDDAESYRYYVRCYNRKGELLWEYQMTPSTLPPAMVTDHYGNILITDSQNNRLCKLDGSGQFLGYLLSNSVVTPHSLAMVNKNMLYVGQKGHPLIQVFKM